jgi:adenosylcobinamide-GDP ribazoletransferase
MGILLALQFLTRIPIPLKREFPPEAWARSMAWFPLVGLLLGLLLAGASWALGLVLPPDIVSALVLILWVALTGGLHLDGFVDCCDALVVALPSTRRLEILKDVHTGTYGVVGAVLLLLLVWLAIGSVSWQGLVLAPVLGRWAMVLVTLVFPYARPSGLGKGFKESLTVRELLIASLIVLVLAVILGLWHGIILVLLAAGTALLVAKWAAHQLGGGITGDVYGMVCEIVEVVTLLAWGVLRA